MAFREFRVDDVMTTPVVSLKETEALPDVQALMQLKRIRHLPVTDDLGKLVGLVTHRDVLAAQLSTLQGLPEDQIEELHSAVSVQSIMRRNVQSVYRDGSLAEAIGLMTSKHFGCLPVVDKQDKLIGIVTEADIVQLAQRILERTRERIPTNRMAATKSDG